LGQLIVAFLLSPQEIELVLALCRVGIQVRFGDLGPIVVGLVVSLSGLIRPRGLGTTEQPPEETHQAFLKAGSFITFQYRPSVGQSFVIAADP
jgi:hypothetical protein